MITKNDCLTVLVALEDRGLNINQPMKKLVTSKEIPLDVLKFILDNTSIIVRRAHTHETMCLSTISVTINTNIAIKIITAKICANIIFLPLFVNTPFIFKKQAFQLNIFQVNEVDNICKINASFLFFPVFHYRSPKDMVPTTHTIAPHHILLLTEPKSIP